MGEIPGSVAEQLKRQYLHAYEGTRTKARINFEDMDFNNAKQRDEMGLLVEEVEQLCGDCEASAHGLSFL